MKVNDHGKLQGAILGKAMTGLKDGKGIVLVLAPLMFDANVPAFVHFTFAQSTTPDN